MEPPERMSLPSPPFESTPFESTPFESTPLERIGLGCMRLPSATKADDLDAEAVISAALEAGVRLLDTAHAYTGERGKLGHNERVVGRALASFGARDDVTVVSKVGMLRPAGRWQPDGRRGTLLKQAEASAGALGRPADLLLLHAPDPGSSPKTWARALTEVVDKGLARSVGLSNMRVDQLDAINGRMSIAAVEQGMHRYDLSCTRSGVLAWCAERGIPLLAHTPLGGASGVKKLMRDAALTTLADKTGDDVVGLALAWLLSAGEHVVALPGATRPSTATQVGELAAAARAGALLTREQLQRLDEGVDGAALLRSTLQERRPATARGQVVVLMGLPGSGKSTRAQALVDDGFERLNRDEEGGTLKGLAERLDRRLSDGAERVVLDNTYGRRADRSRIIETAWEHGAHVSCRHCVIDVDHALTSAALRLIRRHGHLPSPEQLKVLAKEDPHAFAPTALYRHERELELPTTDEGFEQVDEEEWTFVWPGKDGALLLVDEGVLLVDDDEERARRAERLRTAAAAIGGPTAVLAWRPGDDEATARDALRKSLAALGIDATVGLCVHPAGPPRCWCRKPLPGRALELIWQAAACPQRTTLVGGSAADRTLARRLNVDLRAVDDLAIGAT